MGLGLSVELYPVLEEIRKWNWNKVLNISRIFLDEQMNFEIGKNEIIKLTNLNDDYTQQIITLLSRNDGDKINGIIFIILLILLVTEDKSDLLKRKAAVFSLMDFDDTGDITIEEMEIILYCLAMASSSILQRQHLCPSAMQIRALNKKICNDLMKQPDSLISYAEFLKWSEDVVYQSIDKSTTFDVYTYFVKSCGLEIPEEINVDTVSSEFKPDSNEVDNKLYNLEITEISLNNTKGNEQFVELILGKDIFYTTDSSKGESNSNKENPSWNVNLNLETNSSLLNKDPLKIRVKDKNGSINDRVIGRAHVVTDKIISANGEWVDLTGDLIDSDGKVSGIYHIRARYLPKGENLPSVPISSPKKLSPRPQPITPPPPLSTEPGRLDIEEILLNNLKNTELFGKQDPYTEILSGKESLLTTLPIEDGGENPSWNVSFKYETNPALLHDNPLKIRVKDKNGISKDKVIGRAHIDANNAISANGEWIDLTGDLLDGDGKVSGIYHLKARYRPLNDILPEPEPVIEPEPEPEPEVEIDVDAQKSKPLEDDLPYPNFTDEHQSLMRYNLTPEIFDNLKHQRTPNGVTLMQNIQSGIDVPSDMIGLTAGDANSYETFSGIFDPVIEAYQNVSLSNSDSCYVTNRDSSELERMEKIDYTYVISSHIRSRRNVSGHMFSPSISSSQRIELESLLMDALKSMKGEFAGQYHSISDMPNNERERLLSCGLMLSPPLEGSGLESSGVSRNWPQGRGVFSNGTEEFAVWVNGEDHLCIVSQNQGGDIASVFEDWSTAVNGVENCLVSNGMKFEENKRLGYLTTSPSNVGTGFHASMVLKLNGLGSNESKLKSLCDELGLLAIYRPDEDCWELTNKTTLGKTEVEMVQQVIDGVAVITTKQPWL